MSGFQHGHNSTYTASALCHLPHTLWHIAAVPACHMHISSISLYSGLFPGQYCFAHHMHIDTPTASCCFPSLWYRTSPAAWSLFRLRFPPGRCSVPPECRPPLVCSAGTGHHSGNRSSCWKTVPWPSTCLLLHWLGLLPPYFRPHYNRSFPPHCQPLPGWSSSSASGGCWCRTDTPHAALTCRLSGLCRSGGPGCRSCTGTGWGCLHSCPSSHTAVRPQCTCRCIGPHPTWSSSWTVPGRHIGSWCWLRWRRSDSSEGHSFPRTRRSSGSGFPPPSSSCSQRHHRSDCTPGSSRWQSG